MNSRPDNQHSFENKKRKVIKILEHLPYINSSYSIGQALYWLQSPITMGFTYNHLYLTFGKNGGFWAISVERFSELYLYLNIDIL